MDQPKNMPQPPEPNSPLPATTPVAETALAEPPTGAVFTEVPIEAEASVPAAYTLAEPPVEPSDAKSDPVTASSDQSAVVITAPESVKKPKTPSNSPIPVGALSLACGIFIILVAVAYYAYTKSH
jgi:hypothetical protein